MKSERSRALRAVAVAVALAACTGAARLPAPARAAVPPPSSTSRTFRIDARAGSCPKSVAIVTRTRRYEGGAEFEITAQTKSFAVPSRVISGETPHRVEFVAASLAAIYATCEATTRFSDTGSTFHLTLHDRTMRFVILLSPELRLTSARVVSGNPSVKVAVAD